MKEIKYIEKLSRRADGLPPPRVDVADGVMRRIGKIERGPIRADVQLAWVAAMGAAASAPALYVIASVFRAFSDPLLTAFVDFSFWGSL